jgi:hypothetical protein
VIFSVKISQEIIKLRKIGKGDLHIILKVLPNEIIKNMLPYPFNTIDILYAVYILEEEQFLEEIQEGNTDDSIFKRDTVFAHLNYHLDSGHFKLITTKNHMTHGELQPLVEIVFADVRWMSRVCPRNSTWQSTMSLRSVLVKDKMSEGNVFKYLVSDQSKLSSEVLDTSSESVFELEFEKMPKSSKIGYSIKMRTQPLQVVYNPATIERISNFFKRQVSAKKADLHAIEQQILDAAWARYEELKTQTKTGLYHAMDDLLLGQVKVRLD